VYSKQFLAYLSTWVVIDWSNLLVTINKQIYTFDQRIKEQNIMIVIIVIIVIVY